MIEKTLGLLEGELGVVGRGVRVFVVVVSSPEAANKWDKGSAVEPLAIIKINQDGHQLT